MPAPSIDPDDVGHAALEWLLLQGRSDGSAVRWTGSPGDVQVDPTLYSGGAGIVLALIEGHRHFGDERYAEAAVQGARGVAGLVDRWDHSGLYFGLTGMAFALQSLADTYAVEELRESARRALDHVRSRFDGVRWSAQVELLAGNAGIALGALSMGEVDLAVTAVTPYLSRAERTPGGVTWETKAGLASRYHHISHGTLGIVHALASTGYAAGRRDLVDLALAGAADVVSRNEADDAGFLVPHSDPQHRPELIERYSYGWCHGPAGDAQTFRLLHSITGGSAWVLLADRCWHTVTHSGLPKRLRPGFWDNSGRCCGTAGVLALAGDRLVERADDGSFADTLVADLDARATLDCAGARWSNHEHRVTPSLLEPRTGWAMGNAGIIPELLRYARIRTARDPSYAVAWPDHPAARPVDGVRVGPPPHPVSRGLDVRGATRSEPEA